MSTAPGEGIEHGRERGWLYNHIGRLAGIVLGLCFVGFVAFLAVLGYPPAIGLLVVAVAGVLLIALGSMLRGGR